MSFIGNVPAESYSPVVKDTFSGNDSTTDFTLSIPATTNSVEVFVENVQQEPTDAYTISGTTLSFTAAPVSGTDNIYVIHRGPAVQQVVPPAGVAIDASSVTASGNLSVTGTTTLTDDLAVDTDTLFVDASANRVGIGTTSPANTLHVDGTLKVEGSIGTISTDSQGLTLDLNRNGTAGIANQNTGGSQALTFSTGGSEAARIDASANFRFNSGYGSVATAYGCRAWVNFQGKDPLAIRDSGNVSSITDNGAGDYTVNFTSAMPDNDYCANVNAQGPDGADNGVFVYVQTYLAGSLRCGTRTARTTSKSDTDVMNVSIFR